MTATAEDVASDGPPEQSRGAVSAGAILRLLTRPGAFGRASRALAYLWQYGPRATRKMLLLRLGAAPTYRDWISTYDSIRPQERVQLRRRVDRMAAPPLITLLVSAETPDGRALSVLLAATQAQLYSNWELVVAARPQALEALRARLSRTGVEPRLRFVSAPPDTDPAGAGLAGANGAIVLFCAPGYEPGEHALLLIAERLTDRPDTDTVYWDEDEIGAGGARRDPWFKPDWNPDLHLAQNLFGGAVAYRLAAVRAVGGPRATAGDAAVFDLGLRLQERSDRGRIEHIPHVLFHRRRAAISSGAGLADLEARRRAVAEHLQRRGVNAAVTAEPAAEAVRVDYEIAGAEPMVSIIIPTTDRIDLLEP